ncbi:hypothetical protein MLGJGCBP_07937 [Rhodococcus sp. T7]|uniref:Uncharacterized protein n=1 Tax=Rhodococcus opacus RKJ300 = JCM 13270 TaxID=1165867 RepID=I0WYC3_RHOOP|nr:hypothetical protein [Rhodococcus opacus]EID81389.1 hypothetical protein W59_03916 [Rhodococcus opacus RKJ300 = JCM 13270]KAF0958978.1 hypothetical protein MLGJGCBP_07937 [Rhodococcus sp. T7]QQZ19187.1 hypothetical protein GO592_37750 [Rhodococcus sp. 21391]
MAIQFTFTLGTAAGELAGERLQLGYAVSALFFGGRGRRRLARARLLVSPAGIGPEDTAKAVNRLGERLPSRLGRCVPHDQQNDPGGDRRGEEQMV